MSDYQITELQHRTESLLRTLNLMVDGIKAHLPQVGSAIETATQMCQNEFVIFANERNESILTGHGPRATTLREVQELFPSKDIEELISENIPKTYPITSAETFELTTYIDNALKNATFDNDFDNLNWFTDIESNGMVVSFRGEEFFEGLDFGSLPGFYKIRNNRYSSNYNSGNEYALVLHIPEDITYILSSTTQHKILVKVPIENTVASTCDYKYVHVGELKTAFDQLLRETGLAKEKEVYLDNLFEEISSKLIENSILPLSREEFDIFKKTEHDGYGWRHTLTSDERFELAWFEDVFIPTNSDEVSEKEHTVITNIMLKKFNDHLVITRVKTGTEITYNYRTVRRNLENRCGRKTDPDFDQLPILVRESLRYKLLSVIEKMSLKPPSEEVSSIIVKEE